MKEKEQSKSEKETPSKPNSRAEIEKAILKNLQGSCVKGARQKNTGWYSTGHFDLDFAISHGKPPVNVDLDSLEGFDPSQPGGIARGRVVEIYGEPGGGKTSLCLRLVASAQQAGKICIWDDAEKSFVESLATINGVNIDDLLMINSSDSCAEQKLDYYMSAINSGADLIVVDSLVGLIPKAILEQTDSTKDTMGLLARVLGKTIPKIAALCDKNAATVIFINQVRAKMGVMFGDPTTTPGGDVLKFYASTRLQVSKKFGKDAQIWKEDAFGVQQFIAQKSYVRITKNRFAKPCMESIEIPIYFEPFFPNKEEVLFELGRQCQIIKIRNNCFYWKYGDKKEERIEGSEEGRKSFIAALLESGKIEDLTSAIKEKSKELGIVLPPEIVNFESIEKHKVISKAVEEPEAKISEGWGG